MLSDPERNGSLASALNSLVRVAGMTRDSISLDMWRAIRGLDLDALSRTSPSSTALPPGEGTSPAADRVSGELPSRAALGDILDLLDRTVVTLSAFGGLALDSMTRAQGWRFLDMGRRLERSLHTLALLRGTLSQVEGSEGPVLEAVLEVADSSMTYRRRYMSSVQASAVLDLLLADESNPRSLAFQLAALAEHVDHLPRTGTLPGRSPEQRIMLAALTRVRLVDAEALARIDDRGTRSDFETLASSVVDSLSSLSDSITIRYLSHLQPSRHLAPPSRGMEP
jgi:uncharacterized alpha-E superfamily protein